jgi:hypothetical protein
VRDLANMAFIFILIYIAFMIMLKAEVSGTMQMLAKVVVVALIINFSFFLTRLVIDGGNVLAVQFYNAATADAPTIGQTARGTSSAITGAVSVAQAGSNVLGLTSNADIYATKDLTAGIMGAISVQNILNTQTFQHFQDTSNWATEAITLSFIYLAVGIILFILAAIFLSVGIKFIIRIVILWLVIIASPLALVMKTMKQTEKYYNMWQSALVTQAFYPAIFLFLFIIITGFAYAMSGCLPNAPTCAGITGDIVKSLNSQDPSAGGFAVIAAIIANVGIKLGFLVVLLIFALKISDRVSSYGSSLAHGINNWATRRAGGLTFGTAGWAGRNTLGLAGNRFYQSNVGRRIASSNAIGRGLWRGAGAVGKKSFDVRATRGASALGIDLGKARGTGGYAASFDARVKMREEEAKKLKPSASKLDAAYKKAIMGLDEEDKKELAKRANKLAEVQSQFKDGLANSNDVKKANAEFKEFTKKQVIADALKNAKKRAGSDNDKEYAKSITTQRWDNLAGATGSKIPFWQSSADLEAAARIRGSKNESEHIKNVLKVIGIDAPPDDGGASQVRSASNDNTRGGHNPTPSNDNTSPSGDGNGGGRGGPRSGQPLHPTRTDAIGREGSTGSAEATAAMLNKLVKLAERSAKTNEKIATALTAQAHISPANDNRKFEKSVDKRLENIEETVTGANDNIKGNTKPGDKKKAA